MESHTTVRGRPRQRSGPETYARILLAARNEFSARGLLGANLEALAKEAGVAKQVIYNHFGSREGLFEAVLEDINRRCLIELLNLDLSDEPPIDALLAFFGQIYQHYAGIPGLARLVLDFHFHGSVHFRVRELQRKVADRYLSLAERAVAAGDVPGDLDFRALLVFSIAVINDNFLHSQKAWGFEAAADPEMYVKRRETVMRAIRAMFVFRQAPGKTESGSGFA
jgi:AcrR family transcriptional regulator